MMRSMFSSVSGLRAHQVKMDTIGNNIANVNTIGYKSSNTEFAEIFSQTMQGASSPNGGRGGTNPNQVGLGITVNATSVKHTVGSAQRTDAPTDLMINGQGFFVVSDDPTFQNKYYTRAGNFKVDAAGNLVTPTGLKVLGKDGNPVVIDKSITRPGEATTKVELSQNLNLDEKVTGNSTDEERTAYSTSLKVFDSLGNRHEMVFDFGEKLTFKDASSNGTLRNVRITLGPNSKKPDVFGKLDRVDLVSGTAVDDAIYAKFDEKGLFVGLVKSPTIDNATGYVTAVTEVDPKVMTLEPDGADPINLEIVSNTTPKRTIFDKMTHFAMQSDVVGKELDGKGAGKLEEFNIAQSGEVVANFTNGDRKVVSTIMLAGFDNPQGLMKKGNNLFVDTPNSGNPKLGTAGSSGIGLIMAGVIEMSNVDLSQEFTDMITTQRGFQANARVITTSDEMLQELTNLKR